jgi:hypothetical protein
MDQSTRKPGQNLWFVGGAAGFFFGALIAGLVVYFAVHQPTAKTLKDLKAQTDTLVRDPALKKALAKCGITPVRGTCAVVAFLQTEGASGLAAISMAERHKCGVELEDLECLDRELG